LRVSRDREHGFQRIVSNDGVEEADEFLVPMALHISEDGRRTRRSDPPRSWWSKGREPRGMRISNARAGLRNGAGLVRTEALSAGRQAVPARPYRDYRPPGDRAAQANPKGKIGQETSRPPEAAFGNLAGNRLNINPLRKAGDQVGS
jgi:hypothetical protein